MTRWDSDPLVEAPEGAPERTPYLASGWSDGVGRYAWGATPTHARGVWRRRWGRDAVEGRGETTMMDKLDKLAWPAAVVASVALLVTGVLAAGDALGIDGAIVEDAQDALRWLAAMVGAPVLLWLVAQVRSLLADRDRDGTPDILQRPRVSGRRRRETIRPPDEGGPGAGVALLLLGLALGAAAGTSGCGGNYMPHALAANALRDTSNAANVMIREVRANAIREDARAVDPTDRAALVAEIEASAARWDSEHADVLDAQRTAAHATNAYSSGAFRAVQNGDGAEVLSALAGDGLAAVDRLLAIVRRRALPDLPEIPPGVLAFLAGFLGGGQ